jgi:hypothetical protein
MIVFCECASTLIVMYEPPSFCRTTLLASSLLKAETWYSQMCNLVVIIKKSKVKQSLYTPWRLLGGEEV